MNGACLFRVIVRKYDDFPGHYHEYMNLFEGNVVARSEEQIKTALLGPERLAKAIEEDDLKLVIYKVNPHNLDTMIEAVKEAVIGL